MALQSSSRLDPLNRLPAEIRLEIFLHAFIPSNLHLTPSRNPDPSQPPSAQNLCAANIRPSNPTDTSSNPLAFVRLFYLSSSPYTSMTPFTLHTFNITRHFREELLSLLFTHVSFTFTTIFSARYILRYLPPKVLTRITRLTIPIGGQHAQNTPDFGPLQDIQRLIPKNCPNLRILTLELRLQIFESKEKSWDHFVGKNTYRTRLAASYVNGFTWESVETRIPCAERELDADFLRDLRILFGAGNVRYVVTGSHEFAGVRGEVVVGGSNGRERSRGAGGGRDGWGKNQHGAERLADMLGWRERTFDWNM